MNNQISTQWNPGFPVTNTGFLRISASQVGVDEKKHVMILFPLNHDLLQKLVKVICNFAILPLNLFLWE